MYKLWFYSEHKNRWVHIENLEESEIGEVTDVVAKFPRRWCVIDPSGNPIYWRKGDAAPEVENGEPMS
jgi:hypothetical protein